MKFIKPTYRIFALTMAFLMFFTSVGFSIDMHFCQDKMKSFSLFGKAKNCYELTNVKMPDGDSSVKESILPGKTTCSVKRKNCCENKTLKFELDTDSEVQLSSFLISKELQDFVVAYVLVFIKSTCTDQVQTSFEHYNPPIISKDIPVLFETFLL